jgi:hypothetical protein
VRQPKQEPNKSNVSKEQSKNKLQKFQSPPQKLTTNPSTNNLLRVRSTSNLNSVDRSTLNKSQCSSTSGPFLKPMEIRDAATVAKEFIENNLKEVLDLSRCELSDADVLTHIKEVRKHRKIRGLKLCQNLLTDAGFDAIIEYLGTTSNLNLSYNKLTEAALTLMLNKKDKISPLRIINMTFNNINDKKAKVKVESLRKIGMIVNI